MTTNSNTKSGGITDLRKVFQGFQPDLADGIGLRIAKTLNHAVEQKYYGHVSASLLAKIVLFRPKVPLENSDDAQRIRNNLYNAGEKSRTLYMRDIKVDRVTRGIRATSDEDDLIETTIETSARRVFSAQQGLDRRLGMVDPSNIRRGANKSRFSALSEANKRMKDGKILKALMPDNEDDNK